MKKKIWDKTHIFFLSLKKGRHGRAYLPWTYKPTILMFDFVIYNRRKTKGKYIILPLFTRNAIVYFA